MGTEPTFKFQYHETPPRGTDMIVFVHGLIGDLVKTWGKFPELLATDPDLPSLDILLCGYQSRFLRWDPDIERAGGRLIAELETRVKGRSDARIFLVGHSMGGLIILSGLVDACVAGHAQHPPTANVAWLTLFASPALGTQIAAMHRHFLRFLQIPGLGWLGWLFASRQIKQLARGPYIDKLLYNVAARLYDDVAPGEADFKRCLSVRVVIGDEDKVVGATSAQAIFHRLLPKRVTGSHSTLKEPTSHDDPRYLALTIDVAECLRADFNKLCAACLAGDHYAQATFDERWARAVESRLLRAFPEQPDEARRKALCAVTWRMAASDATLTPGRALDAAMMEVKYHHAT